MKTQYSGIIIIKHEVLESISDTEVIAALPEEYKNLPRHTISVVPEEIKLGEARLHYWPALIAEQDRIFEEEVRPLQQRYPNYQILYFGLAPIPLAMRLGYKVGSLGKAEAFLRHHSGKKTWEWRDLKAGEPKVEGLPKEVHKSTGEIVIRTGTRFRILTEETEEVIPDPDKEIEIYPPELGQDIFGSFEQLAEYAAAFSKVLDRIKDNLPEAQGIHLFAAIPVGLAFLMGQEINPNAHLNIHVYEYSKDGIPTYQQTFIVNEERNIETIEITETEQNKFKQQRQWFEQDEVEIIKETLFPDLKESGLHHWFTALPFTSTFPSNPFDQIYWNHLIRLDKAGLDKSFLNINKAADEVGKNYENDYYFDDVLLKQLNRLLPKREDIETAFRLYCFRESIHSASHGIRASNIKITAQYPRAVEEADYQADVYALIHEFAYQKYPIEKAAYYFVKLIQILTQTMWAFDRQHLKSDVMEVHRVNRYLVWYYLACKVQKCSSLEAVLELLATKPILELRLQSLQSARGKKVVFKLDKVKENELGICIFNQGKLNSFPNEIGILSLTDLIEGLREHVPEKVQEVMNALITKIEMQS